LGAGASGRAEWLVHQYMYSSCVSCNNTGASSQSQLIYAHLSQFPSNTSFLLTASTHQRTNNLMLASLALQLYGQEMFCSQNSTISTSEALVQKCVNVTSGDHTNLLCTQTADAIGLHRASNVYS